MFKLFSGIFKTFISPFKKEFWIKPFPDCYEPECFDCKEGNCVGCQHNK